MTANVIHFYILLIIAMVLIWLSIRMFVKYQKSQAINFLGFLFLGLAILAILTGVIGLSVDDELVLILTRFGYFFGVFVFSMMLMTSWYFPLPLQSHPRRLELLWIIPVTFFLPLALLSNQLVQGVEKVSGSVKEVAGSLFFLFPLFLAVYFFWSLVNLIKKLSFIQGEQRKHLKLIIIGLCLGAGSAVIFDALLPFFNIAPKHFVSIELASVFIGSSVYIATKK